MLTSKTIATSNSSMKDFTIIKKLGKYINPWAYSVNFNPTYNIGEGSFSEVYNVRRKNDNTIYAMKKVKMGKLSGKEKENALNEVRILASINHPNVIGYKEAFFEDQTGHLCIVMEFADGGDLLQMINAHKKAGSSFTEKQVWHIFI